MVELYGKNVQQNAHAQMFQLYLVAARLDCHGLPYAKQIHNFAQCVLTVHSTM